MKVKSESKDYQDYQQNANIPPDGVVCQDGADCTRRGGGTELGCSGIDCGIAINTIDVGA